MKQVWIKALLAGSVLSISDISIAATETPAPQKIHAHRVKGDLFTAKEIATFDAKYLIKDIKQFVVTDGTLGCRVVPKRDFLVTITPKMKMKDITLESADHKQIFKFENILAIDLKSDAEDIYVNDDKKGQDELKICLTKNKMNKI